VKYLYEINIRVDSRAELLSIIQLFTSWSKLILIEEDYFYKREALRWFKPYGGHRAIKLCEYLMELGCLCMPVGFMTHLTEPPELKIEEKLDLNTIYTFTIYISDKLGYWFNKYYNSCKAERLFGINRSRYALLPGLNPRAEEELMLLGEIMAKRTLNEFAKCLRDFVYKSHFMEFINNHKNFYDGIARKSGLRDEVSKIIRGLEDLFGQEYGYVINIVLCPLYRIRICFGHMFNNKIFVFVGPNHLANDLPEFEGMTDCILNELIRGFTTPTYLKFFDEIMEYSSLFRYLGEHVKSTHGTWLQAFNAHVASALGALVKLYYMNVPERSIISYLNKEEKNGFTFIKDFYKTLDEYVKKRDKHDSFEEFFPRLIKLLEELDKKSCYNGWIPKV